MNAAETAEKLLVLLREREAARSDRSVPFILAIDGRAASGKSTLASLLSSALGAPVIRMDDFFLPPELRTKERYETPGGNLHSERFAAEVLPFLALPAPFSYRRFDCGKMALDGDVPVASARFRIVEGSYSLHPAFGRYADLSVFLTVSPEEQLARVRLRGGAPAVSAFSRRWIPLEESYFSFFSIPDRADVRIKNM